MEAQVGIANFNIKSHEVDFRKKLTLPFLFQYLFRTSEKQTLLHGLDLGTLNRRNLSWVLSHVEIEMTEYPMYYEAVEINTWVEKIMSPFMIRNFEIKNKDNNTIGLVRTIWALFDLEERAVKDLKEFDLSGIYLPEKVNPMVRGKKIRLPEEVDYSYNYTVKTCDLDINKHLTTCKYVERILDTFDIEMFEQHEISRIDIDFISECKFGDKITIGRLKVDNEYLCSIKKDNEIACKCRIMFK